MLTQKTDPKDIVPIGQKIAFGAGNLTNQLLPAALGVFMFFLVVGFGMSPYKAGILAAIPRFIDAILDPIMGFISDNTRSRWGRRRPYIFGGAIVTGIAFIAMWQLKIPEAGNNHETYNFLFFLVMSVIFYLGYTVFAAPLIGLGYEMTPDYNERTRLMAMSQIMGQIAWMIAPWFWFLISRPELFPNAPTGIKQLSIWVGLLCVVMGVMPALFCKEIDQANLQGQTNLSFKSIFSNVKHFFTDIKKTVTNKPFLRLCAATFLVFNGFQIVAQFAFFIIIYYMYNGDQQAAGQWPAWFGTISAVATAVLVIPVITYMSTRMGKRNAFILSTIISIVGYALKWWGFHPGNPWLMFLPIPLMSFGIGGLFTLMMSMTADVCDYDEMKNGMPRKEALFGAVYWWMVKLGTSLALFLSGVILSSVGFDQNAKMQSESTITALRLADIFVPCLAGILAVLVMWGYDISEKRAKEIREELVRRRGDL